jgi:hypothetical protein
MHPIEAAWRRFRNSERHELFKRSLEARESYLDFLRLKRCPAEVTLPLAVPF